MGWIGVVNVKVLQGPLRDNKRRYGEQRYPTLQECFLYSLALQWDVDVPALELTAESVQAAFVLQQAYRVGPQRQAGQANNAQGMEMDQQ